MADTEHQPDRPSWNCRVCGQQWPCELARKFLAEDTGGGTALAMACWAFFDIYVHDQGAGPLGEAFNRFISWSR